MGDMGKNTFIENPLALPLKDLLGAHYNTENATKAPQAKDAERPPDTRWGLYHGPAVKVGYPLTLPAQAKEQDQKQDQYQDQDRGRAGSTELNTVNTVAEFATENAQDQNENKNNLRGEALRRGF